MKCKECPDLQNLNSRRKACDIPVPNNQDQSKSARATGTFACLKRDCGLSERRESGMSFLCASDTYSRAPRNIDTMPEERGFGAHTEECLLQVELKTRYVSNI